MYIHVAVYMYGHSAFSKCTAHNIIHVVHCTCTCCMDMWTFSSTSTGCRGRLWIKHLTQQFRDVLIHTKHTRQLTIILQFTFFRFYFCMMLWMYILLLHNTRWYQARAIIFVFVFVTFLHSCVIWYDYVMIWLCNTFLPSLAEVKVSKYVRPTNSKVCTANFNPPNSAHTRKSHKCQVHIKCILHFNI